MESELKKIKIFFNKNNQCFIDECLFAEKFLDRLKGLLFYKKLNPNEALLIDRCNNIHMWFMSISIDVIFLSKKKEKSGKVYFFVTSLYKNVAPWKFFPIFDFKAICVLELPLGTIEKYKISIGDSLCIN